MGARALEQRAALAAQADQAYEALVSERVRLGPFRPNDAQPVDDVMAMIRNSGGIVLSQRYLRRLYRQQVILAA